MLEGPGIERQPPAIGGHDPVRDHQVRVQLRVVRPAGVLAKRGRDQAAGVDDPHLAIDPVATVGVVLDPPERRGDRRIVSVEHLLADTVVAYGVQDRHRLRCRAGDVEPAHGALVVARAQQLASGRVPAIHERQEVAVVDLPGEAERSGAMAEPPTGRLVAVEVIPAGTVDVVRPGVGALERGHPGGHGRLPHAGVHSSVCCCDACARASPVTGRSFSWRGG